MPGVHPATRKRGTMATVVREARVDEIAPAPPDIQVINDEPLAVTPLAQVHAASLPDGTAVVVKVIRPGLVEHEGEQAWAMSLMASLARRFLPKGVSFDRDEFVRQLTVSYHHELDLRTE